MKKLLLFCFLLGGFPAWAANNGTIVGTPTFGAAKFSTGLTSTTDANYITLPTAIATAIASGTFTVELWVNTAGTATEVATSIGPNWIGINAPGQAGYDYTAMGFNTFSSTLINNSIWRHLVIVGRPTAVNFFLDGTLITTSPPGTFASPGAILSYIGRHSSLGFAFTGKTDEVSFWSIAKYASNFTSPISAYTGAEAGLIALYHLDGNALDSVGAGTGSLLSLAPTSVTTSSTGNAIALTGSATTWTAGTPGTPTFTIAGGCTITAQTVASATSATLTVTAPGTAGTCTVTDPSNSTTLSITVNAPIVSGAVKYAAPIRLAVYSVNPASCLRGDVFFRTGVPDGQNIYGCPAANTPVLQGGTGGGGIGVLTGDILNSGQATTVIALRNRTVAITTPTNGQALVWNGGTSQWEPQNQSGTGGGGASSVTQLTDLKVTLSTTTALAVASGNVIVSGVSYLIGVGTVGISAGTGTVRIAVDTSVTPPVGKVYFSPGITATCSGMGGCTAPVADTAFGKDDLQLAMWTVSTGTFDSNGATDLRGIVSKTRLIVGPGGGLLASISGHTQSISVDSAIYPVVLSGVTASIGGGALGAGTCATTTTSVIGVTVGMVVRSTPSTFPGDATEWKSYISAPDTVVTKVCAIVAATPVASVYNLRVLP